MGVIMDIDVWIYPYLKIYLIWELIFVGYVQYGCLYRYAYRVQHRYRCNKEYLTKSLTFTLLIIRMISGFELF